MISKELKQLGRRELVDIIYQLKKNEQELQEEIAALKDELEDKRIRMSNVGSIADAAMTVTNIFATAQATADLYLREISYMKEGTERECARKIEETEKKVNEILVDGEKQLENLKQCYQSEYKKWQKLHSEVADLQQKKTQESQEDVDNGL